MMYLKPKPKLRITAVLVMVAVSVGRAAAYLVESAPPDPVMLAFVGPLIPNGGHAIPWIIVAVLGLVALFWNKTEPVVVGAFSGLHVLWGASMAASSVVLDEPRAWVGALSYFTIAAFTGILFGMVDPADAKRARRQHDMLRERPRDSEGDGGLG